MAIKKAHLQFYREIFDIPHFLSEPCLMFGFQDVVGEDLPEDFRFKNGKDLLISKGVKDIQTLDFFDNRADLRYDMNIPIPESLNEKYSLFLDIGCLEHLFDTKQCLENCLRMVRLGGFYMLQTVINGYFRHGLHVFNPEGLINVLKANNFEVLYLKYSLSSGLAIDNPSLGGDVLIWIVAKKIRSINNITLPQQQIWVEFQENQESGKKIIPARRNLKSFIYRILCIAWRPLACLKERIKKNLQI